MKYAVIAATAGLVLLCPTPSWSATADRCPHDRPNGHDCRHVPVPPVPCPETGNLIAPAHHPLPCPTVPPVPTQPPAPQETPTPTPVATPVPVAPPPVAPPPPVVPAPRHHHHRHHHHAAPAPAPVLPKTGNGGPTGLLLFGAAALLGTGGVLIRRRRT